MIMLCGSNIDQILNRSDKLSALSGTKSTHFSEFIIQVYIWNSYQQVLDTPILVLGV